MRSDSYPGKRSVLYKIAEERVVVALMEAVMMVYGLKISSNALMAWCRS